METTKKEERFDVVIYEIKTGKVDTVAGQDMPLDSGSFHTAEKRLETVLPRLNGRYSAAIVPAGIYDVGATVAKKHR